tara:strand:- start:2104 stop:2226 length:123 start_codon:yes stop_codon:yes gene_type:complete
MEINLYAKVRKIKCGFYQAFLFASNFLNKFVKSKNIYVYI